jgi:hypothetical protein
MTGERALAQPDLQLDGGFEARAAVILGASIGRCWMLSCRSPGRRDRQSRGDSGLSARYAVLINSLVDILLLDVYRACQPDSSISPE